MDPTTYVPFSLGARFETYEQFISLVFQFFFSCRGKPLITETEDTESADTEVRLYNVIIVWDHRRICGPSLTETSLCGAYLYTGDNMAGHCAIRTLLNEKIIFAQPIKKFSTLRSFIAAGVHKSRTPGHPGN